MQMRDLFKDHEHVFDDCKCCGLNYVCDCGFTQYELSLEQQLKDRDEDVRKLKAQMKTRHQDYAKTLSDVTGELSLLWKQMHDEEVCATLDEKANKKSEKENET